ncbi:hypothetical protein AB0D60_11950 [Streptomyces sp. NPDC048306]|uniref:hypothetical protein n=1 Tax=Streptomyces sp. NPDC048306 TaxID=3154502 RepID=UPI003405216D
MIVTTSRTDKEQRLRDLGADEVINYRDIPNWHTAPVNSPPGEVSTASSTPPERWSSR